MESPISSINVLQELMGKKGKPYPKYTISNSGTSFICHVEVDSIKSKGFGRTKKEAKHESAQNALIAMGISSNARKEMVKPQADPISENHVGKLNEVASSCRTSHPKYEDSFDIGNNLFRVICRYRGRETEGSGPNKRSAKQMAAREMLAQKFSPDEGLRSFDLDNHGDLDLKVLRMFEETFIERNSAKKIETQTETERGENRKSVPREKANYTLQEAEEIVRGNGLRYVSRRLKVRENVNCVVVVVEIAGKTLIGCGGIEKEALAGALNWAITVMNL